MTAKPAEWYDEVYANEPNLLAPAEESTFGLLWGEVARRVPSGLRVVELGCGAGQLASLIAWKCRGYLGLDFSQEAINHASSSNVGSRDTMFLVEDITDSNLRLDSADLWIACEVLEHLDDDLGLLKKLSGKHVILTLPSRDSESHVRFFPKAEDVRKRYGHLFRFEMVYDPHIQWWIVEGELL